MARKKKPDKLSQDVSKAIAAGMSYGKWKAMQEPVAIQKTIPEVWKKCICCGKAFKPNDPRQKYCDSICQHQVNAKKHRERERQRRKSMKG